MVFVDRWLLKSGLTVETYFLKAFERSCLEITRNGIEDGLTNGGSSMGLALGSSS